MDERETIEEENLIEETLSPEDSVQEVPELTPQQKDNLIIAEKVAKHIAEEKKLVIFFEDSTVGHPFFSSPDELCGFLTRKIFGDANHQRLIGIVDAAEGRMRMTSDQLEAAKKEKAALIAQLQQYTSLGI